MSRHAGAVSSILLSYFMLAGAIYTHLTTNNNTIVQQNDTAINTNDTIVKSYELNNKNLIPKNEAEKIELSKMDSIINTNYAKGLINIKNKKIN